MKKPDRYDPRARSVGGPWKMVKCKDGPYVDFEQHQEIVAALAAEYVELKDLYLKCRIDIGNLHKENERMRKAGDAMYHTAQQDGTGLWLHKSFQDWDAAKEGRDAK